MSLAGTWLSTKRIAWAAAVALALINCALIASVQLDKIEIRTRAYAIVPPGSSQGTIVNEVVAYVRDQLPHCTIQEVDAMSTLNRWNYRYNPFKPGPATILGWGTHHSAPCQSNSRALIALLAAHGISSRMVIEHDADLVGIHSAVEIDYEGCRGIADPTYGLVFQHDDGRPATLKELRADKGLFEANARRGYGFGWGRNAKCTVRPLPTELYNFEHAHYFNFHWFGPARWFVLNTLQRLGGLDGPDWLIRPSWYSFPAYSIAVVMDSAAIFGLVCIYLFCRIRNRKMLRGGRAQLPPRTLLDSPNSKSVAGEPTATFH